MTAPRLIPTVLGPEWEPAVRTAMILSLVGVLQAIGASVGPLMLATGAVGTLVKWGIASSITVVCAFVIGLTWGIEGVAAAYLVVSLLLIYPAFAIALHPIGLGLADVIAETWRPMVAAGVMAALVATVSLAAGPSVNQVAILVVEIALGVAAYSGLSLVLNRNQTRLVLARLTGA